MNFSMIAFTVTPNKISEASLLPVSIRFIFKFPQLFQRRLLVLVVTMLELLPRPVLCCYGCGSNPTISSSPSPLTSFHPSGRARGQRDIQFSSVQFSSVARSCRTLQPHELPHARPPCPSPCSVSFIILRFVTLSSVQSWTRCERPHDLWENNHNPNDSPSLSPPFTQCTSNRPS